MPESGGKFKIWLERNAFKTGFYPAKIFINIKICEGPEEPSPKDYYKQKYLEAFQMVIEFITDRFEQGQLENYAD